LPGCTHLLRSSGMAQRTGTSSRTGGGPSLTTTPTGYQLSSRRVPSGWPPQAATAAALDVASHRVGRKAIAHFIADDFPRLFARDVTITFHGVYVEGDRVIVEETMSATLASGNAYVNDYCCVFELQGGLVHRAVNTWTPHGGTAWCPPPGAVISRNALNSTQARRAASTGPLLRGPCGERKNLPSLGVQRGRGTEPGTVSENTKTECVQRLSANPARGIGQW
jgi:hypothetical protein